MFHLLIKLANKDQEKICKWLEMAIVFMNEQNFSKQNDIFANYEQTMIRHVDIHSLLNKTNKCYS